MVLSASIRPIVVWATVAAIVSVVFRAPGVSVIIAVGLSASAAALVSGSVAVALPRAVNWVGPLCCTTVIGAMAQIRLGVGPSKVLLILALALCAFVVIVWRARGDLDLNSATAARAATTTVIGCFVLRVVLPILIDPTDLLYFTTGTIALPGTGIGVQTGEFTRPFLFAAVGVILWQSVSTGAHHPSRKQSWVVALGTSGYVAALAVVDNGPAVLTVVGLLIVLLLTVGGRRSARAVVGWARRTAARITLAVSVLSVVVVLSQFGSFAERAPGRFLSLLDPNEQMRAGFQAMQRGGLVGSGMGTSPFALGVPVAKTDLLPAVLAADLGMALLVAIALVILGAISAAVIGGMKVVGVRGAIAVAIGIVLFLQAAWPLLANVGVAPLTGVSVPFLVVSTSSLVPAAISLALIIGIVANVTSSEWDGPSLRPRSEFSVNVVRTLVGAALVIAVLILVLFVPPVSNAAQIYMPRGEIRTLDGEVVATTDTEGRRQYPNGATYTEVGLIHPEGAQYAVEGTMANELTCGGPPSIQDRLFVVLRPLPCSKADVITTIDSELQRTAVAALQGRSGSVSVLDSINGKVRALYSSDDIDPAEFREDDLPGLPPVMHARQESATLGSVFKIVTAAAGLLDGVTTSTAPLNVYSANGETLKNFDGSTCPSTSFRDMIAFSCNTVAAEIGVAVGQERLQQVAAEYFAAGEQIPFDAGDFGVTPLETGLAGGPRSEMEIARTSIGQEGATGNTLALAVATAQVVHSATQDRGEAALPSPRLIEGTCTTDRFVPYSFDSTVGMPLPTQVASQVLEGMEAAVSEGTASGLSGSGRSLAAKTGTADTTSPEYPVNSWITLVVDDRWILSVVVHTSAGGAGASTIADSMLSRFPTSFKEPTCN